MYRIFLPLFLALFIIGIPLPAQVPEEGIEIEIEVDVQGENTTPIIRTPQIIPIPASITRIPSQQHDTYTKLHIVPRHFKKYI